MYIQWRSSSEFAWEILTWQWLNHKKLEKPLYCDWMFGFVVNKLTLMQLKASGMKAFYYMLYSIAFTLLHRNFLPALYLELDWHSSCCWKKKQRFTSSLCCFVEIPSLTLTIHYTNYPRLSFIMTITIVKKQVSLISRWPMPLLKMRNWREILVLVTMKSLNTNRWLRRIRSRQTTIRTHPSWCVEELSPKNDESQYSHSFN